MEAYNFHFLELIGKSTIPTKIWGFLSMDKSVHDCYIAYGFQCKFHALNNQPHKPKYCKSLQQLFSHIIQCKFARCTCKSKSCDCIINKERKEICNLIQKAISGEADALEKLQDLGILKV